MSKGIEGGRRRVADHRRVLLLPVHAALGAGRHDAAALGGLRPERDGRRVDGRPLLLGLLAVQPRRRRGDGPASGRAGSSRSARPPSASGRCCSPRATASCASVGRLLQGAGGVFALIGAVYIATTSFPASMAATLIGATQMFGMAGGSAGQFVVGPVIASGVPWSRFWLGHGRRRAGRSARCSYVADPGAGEGERGGDWLKSAAARAWASSSATRSRSCAA